MESVYNVKGFVTIPHYAQMCGITYNGVMRRVEAGKIWVTEIDGIKFIDTRSFPPQKRQVDEEGGGHG